MAKRKGRGPPKRGGGKRRANAAPQPRIRKQTNMPSGLARESRLSNEYGLSSAKTYLTMLVCSKVNPFCKDSIGSKQDDESSSYSLPFRGMYFVPAASDASGNGAFTFNASPGLQYAGYTSINNGTGVITWGAVTAAPYYTTSISSKMTQYRVVSFGVKYTTTQAWTTAQGVFIGQTLTSDPTTTGTSACNSLNVGYDAQVVPLRDATMYFVAKPFDMTWREYQPVGTDGEVSAQVAPWTSVLFTQNGCAATIFLGTYEVVANYELLPIPSNTSVQTVIPDKSTMLSAHVNKIAQVVQSKMPSTFQAPSGNAGGNWIDDVFLKEAGDAIGKLGRSIIPNIGTMFADLAMGALA